MLRRIADISIRFPKLVIITFLAITIFFAFQISNTKIDTAIKSQIPDDMPSRKRIDKIEEIFGGTEIIMINIKADDVLDAATLKRVKKISDELKNVEQVEKVNSLFTTQDVRGIHNQLIVEDAVKEIPQTTEEKQALRQRIKDNELIYGNIIAKNFKAVSVVGVLQEDFTDQVVLHKVKKIINKVPGKGKIQLAGMPIVRAKMSSNTRRDMRLLVPIGLLIMLIFLYVCFKQFRGVILPFMVVVMSIIVSIGLISLFDWKFQMLTIILPMALIAITNDYGIHIIAHYQEENKKGFSITEKELSKKVVTSLGKPIIATGVTTIVGMLCLLAHIIVPAQQLGVLAAVGISFALVASMTFMPAVLSLLPKADPLSDNKQGDKQPLLERFLHLIANFVTSNPKKIIAGSVLIVILISIGIMHLKIDTNPVNYFTKSSQVVQATNTANKYFGGANTISIVAEGDIKHPDIMKRISKLEQKLKEHKNIGEVTAVSKIMRKMNKEFHNGKSKFDRIPDSRNAMSQYFMLYTMSDDLDKLVDFDRKHAMITARISTNSTTKIKGIVNYINNYINQMGNSPFVLIGGYGDLLSELVDSVVNGQVISLLYSIGVVGLIVMVLFSSITAGIISVLPLILAIFSLFGLMGYFNIELNIITALLSSIMIGVGIDYTIHFLWRYRKEKQTKDSIKAVKDTLTTTGRGITFNALSVIIGFISLMISNFLPVKFFGFLVVVSISGCLIGSLILLPAICIVYEPKFLETFSRTEDNVKEYTVKNK